MVISSLKCVFLETPPMAVSHFLRWNLQMLRAASPEMPNISELKKRNREVRMVFLLIRPKVLPRAQY